MNCRSKRRGATHRRRLLRCERLEPRFLLAGDGLDRLDDLTFIPEQLEDDIADIGDDLSGVDTNVASDSESPDTTLDDLASNVDIQAAPAARHNPDKPLFKARQALEASF